MAQLGSDRQGSQGGGKVGSVLAWRGRQGTAKPSLGGAERGMAGEARHGGAGLGESGSGKAGKASRGRSGKAWHGAAWQARRGLMWSGWSSRGGVGLGRHGRWGRAGQSMVWWAGQARQVAARYGLGMAGGAGLGKDGEKMNRVDYDVAMEIASHEAIIRQAYKDSVGVWTWSVGLTNGSGHDVTRYIGKPQSLEHCLKIYVWALDKYAKDVRVAFSGHPLTKAQFAAALSFHWNTGAIKRASWVRHFKAGNIPAARKAFMNWVKPPEITARRRKERDLFFDGKWSNNGTMTEYTRLTSRSTPVWSSGKRINVERELKKILGEPIIEPDPIKNDTVLSYQARLAALGYHPGVIDGINGRRTKAALRAFQLAEGITVDGIWGPETERAMVIAEGRPGPKPDPEPAQTSWLVRLWRWIIG